MRAMLTEAGPATREVGEAAGPLAEAWAAVAALREAERLRAAEDEGGDVLPLGVLRDEIAHRWDWDETGPVSDAGEALAHALASFVAG